MNENKNCHSNLNENPESLENLVTVLASAIKNDEEWKSKCTAENWIKENPNLAEEYLKIRNEILKK